MKVLINGVEAQLTRDPSVRLDTGGDRLYVTTPEGTFSALAVKVGSKTLISFRGESYEIEKIVPGRKAGSPESTGEFRSTMPGQVVDVFVADGDSVEKGQKLLILEAMKMQTAIVAPFDGVLEHLAVAKGDQVSDGQLLLRVAPSQAE